MKCRICNSADVSALGDYRPFLDFKTAVYHCRNCRCRFAEHDESIYERLHATGTSPYGGMEALANEAIEAYGDRAVKGLRQHLCKIPKYRHVIDTVDSLPGISNMLEIGCSRGYLTAYFAATGKRILGVDVSPSAIAFARKSFGDHFCHPGDPRIESRAPYDVVYHTGTIGCVSSPTELTEYLLSLLQPGRSLVFNSPNVAVCEQLGSIWQGTPPPDVVTLFHESFWRKRFSRLARVDVSYEPRNVPRNVRLTLGRLLGKPYPPKARTRLFGAKSTQRQAGRKLRGLSTAWLRTCKRAFFVLLGTLPVWPEYATDFGMYVRMTRRSGETRSTDTS